MSSHWTEERVIGVIKECFSQIVAPGARDLVDDGAWLPSAPLGSTRVVSCDAFQEGNDFLLQIAPVMSAGHRAIVQNISDLAAMGAKPMGFLWSLEVPKRWLKGDAKILRQFCDGAAQVSVKNDLLFYGGDLSFSSNRFSCTITIFGDTRAEPLSRQGAKVGDLIYVSRPVGLSSYGLRILLKKLRSRRSVMSQLRFGEFVETLAPNEKIAVLGHLWPSCETALGQNLAGIASACMDISDGLARDLHRLCRASKVGADLDNLEAAFHIALPGEAAREYATVGGEDFALLITAAPTVNLSSACIQIGTVTDQEGVVLAGRGKRRIKIKPSGFDHFVSRT